MPESGFVWGIQLQAQQLNSLRYVGAGGYGRRAGNLAAVLRNRFLLSLT